MHFIWVGDDIQYQISLPYASAKITSIAYINEIWLENWCVTTLAADDNEIYYQMLLSHSCNENSLQNSDFSYI